MKTIVWLAVVVVVGIASVIGTLALTDEPTRRPPSVVAKSTTFCEEGGEITDDCWAEAKVRARGICRSEKHIVVAIEVTIDRGIESDQGFGDGPDTVALASRLPFVETMTCRRLLNFE